MHDVVARPGPLFGSYPENRAAPRQPMQAFFRTLSGPLHRRRAAGLNAGGEFAGRVESAGTRLRNLNSARLAELTAAVSRRLRVAGFADEATASAFALAREYSIRALGLRHYESQIIGGWAILHGRLAEMETGEGKTLTASLPASVAALAGIPVHVITVNDYLARRDMEMLAPLYRLLGISVGLVTEDMQDPALRQRAYACDVTYCTNKQIAFDYLRDRVTMGHRQGAAYRTVDRLNPPDSPQQQLLLRGLCFGIVDEADSVLIDEARTPLKLSGRTDGQFDESFYRRATQIAGELSEISGTYRLQAASKRCLLTAPGRARLAKMTAELSAEWQSVRRRELVICQALAARHLYVRDQDYIVQDDTVRIVDQNTGRVMADRTWERGLHQLIEIKEKVSISQQTTSIAQITYQRLFRRYLRLGAMSGTATEVAPELWKVYGLRVISIPSHQPCQRKQLPTRVFATEADKHRWLLARLQGTVRQGRPVLVGTRTVAGSERLSELLQQAGLAHQVLNARQDSREAGIIARAGQRSGITIATNMAGRGTDIALTPETRALGGLQVIAAEPNEARRIDRQLFGRCGRQGDPGSFETLISLEDELLQNCAPRPVKNLFDSILCRNGHVLRRAVIWLMRSAQWRLERRYARARRDLLRRDEQFLDLLAFGGMGE